jgi:hypothetical protein
MTRLEFRNRLCILRSIDRHELVEAGVLAADDVSMWNVFAVDPYRWFLLRDDDTAEKLWRLIERRATPPLRAPGAKVPALMGDSADSVVMDKDGNIIREPLALKAARAL